MRKINTSFITTSIAMPVKSGTIDHIQSGYTEAIREVAQGLIGSGYSNATPYILSGLVNVSAHPTYNLSAGSIFYDGEVYLVDAVNFTLTGTQVAIMNIVTTQFTGVNADSVKFNDGVSRNVHDIRKIAITPGIGGTGIANFVDAQRINSNRPDTKVLSGTGISVTGSFPNFTVNNTSLNTPEVLAQGSIPIGDLNTTTDLDAFTSLLSGSSSGLSGYRYVFPVALPVGTQYKILLLITNNGYSTVSGFLNNGMLCIQSGGWDHLGFYFAISTSNTGGVQAITVDYILVKS